MKNFVNKYQLNILSFCISLLILLLLIYFSSIFTVLLLVAFAYMFIYKAVYHFFQMLYIKENIKEFKKEQPEAKEIDEEYIKKMLDQYFAGENNA